MFINVSFSLTYQVFLFFLKFFHPIRFHGYFIKFLESHYFIEYLVNSLYFHILRFNLKILMDFKFPNHFNKFL
jgi:hypothetical protein